MGGPDLYAPENSQHLGSRVCLLFSLRKNPCTDSFTGLSSLRLASSLQGMARLLASRFRTHPRSARWTGTWMFRRASGLQGGFLNNRWPAGGGSVRVSERDYFVCFFVFCCLFLFFISFFFFFLFLM